MGFFVHTSWRLPHTTRYAIVGLKFFVAPRTVYKTMLETHCPTLSIPSINEHPTCIHSPIRLYGWEDWTGTDMEYCWATMLHGGVSISHRWILPDAFFGWWMSLDLKHDDDIVSLTVTHHSPSTNGLLVIWLLHHLPKSLHSNGVWTTNLLASGSLTSNWWMTWRAWWRPFCVPSPQWGCYYLAWKLRVEDNNNEVSLSFGSWWGCLWFGEVCWKLNVFFRNTK